MGELIPFGPKELEKRDSRARKGKTSKIRLRRATDQIGLERFARTSAVNYLHYGEAARRLA
jgi:hypothetical protein